MEKFARTLVVVSPTGEEDNLRQGVARADMTIPVLEQPGPPLGLSWCTRPSAYRRRWRAAPAGT
jgi:hypothetical protein